jgi:hypothetical protein
MDARKLTALGYQVGPKLKYVGLEVVYLESQLRQKLLFVTSRFWGPSWPQIHFCLSGISPEPRPLSFRKTPSLLLDDTPESRAILESLTKTAKASRQSEVHIDDIGFVELEGKPLRDLKQFVLPSISVVVVLFLSFIWGSASTEPIEDSEQETRTSCIVDSSQTEFEAWLASSLASESLTANQSLEVATDLGRLELSVDSTIGSAAKVSGVAVCADGRELVINHRVDTSGMGAVLELGQ